MKAVIFTLMALGFTVSGPAWADDPKPDVPEPIELTATQMDRVTAGGLALPNGSEVFVDLLLRNGAPHPALAQSPVLGPWQAHFNSPVIGFIPPQ